MQVINDLKQLPSDLRPNLAWHIVAACLLLWGCVRVLSLAFCAGAVGPLLPAHAGLSGSALVSAKVPTCPFRRFPLLQQQSAATTIRPHPPGSPSVMHTPLASAYLTSLTMSHRASWIMLKLAL